METEIFKTTWYWS